MGENFLDLQVFAGLINQDFNKDIKISLAELRVYIKSGMIMDSCLHKDNMSI